MYKVMVVDDEPLVRLAVKSLVNWETHGFILELEASNGKQAMKMLEENPDTDIIITDINMPVMDGLELIEKVIAKGWKTEIIVLSAYNDYAWVRTAFKLGVNDYILKTEMEPEGILHILKGMAEKIENKKCSSNAAHIGYTNRDIRYQREIILKSLLEQEDIQFIQEEIWDMGLRINGKNMAVCYLWIDDYQTVQERYNSNTLKPFTQSVCNSINQVLTDTNVGEVLCLSPQEYIMFLCFDDLSLKQNRDKISDVLGRVKHSLINYVNISASIGVSDVRYGLSNIKQLFLQAKENARLRFIFGKNKIIFPEDADRITKGETESLIGKEAGFLNALRAADIEKVQFELEKLLDVISHCPCNKIEKIYSNYMELIFITISFLNEIGKDVEEVFGKEIDFYEKIVKFETQEEINRWIRNIITWVVNFLQENKSMKVSRTIACAREFIRSNYSNDNLTLKLVSDYVQLSESHFSSTFTKEMGQTFIDYLTKVRIEKAKELIATTNLKIYEICEKVGYTNTEHFSRIFKRIVGSSPKDYKKM